jgi:serine phosphatase RsbU (regulator of sigma subunit)
LFWVFAALFIGLAYGSGEGDMREANPGKLTSLDALLLGKFFSRNVARAMVWGCAMGGWLLLAIQLALLVWYQRPNTGEELLPLTIFYGDFPLFTILTSWLPDVVLVMVIGLLAPWPLLQRRLRSARWQIVALACFTWVACQGPLLGQRPWLSVLAIAVLKTAFVLLAFFNFDLLTAGVVYALPSFVKFAVTIGAQPAAGFRQTGRVALGLAAAWLLVELVFAFKGRWLRAEEVRPIYARNLAERLSLQAEVSAAREAQQRLLPQSLPLSPYFTVAASCVPAREVGGDFFDFFEVGPGRLGVLVAEGGGKGLPSALSIAYAKGFLMPKIGGQTRGDDSPTEVLRGLQEQLNLMMGHDEDIGLAYLVLDTSEGVARYARIGQYPQIVLGNSVAPEEREIKFSTGANPRETISVIEGRIELGGGDGVMIFTGGLVEAWKNNKQTPSGEFTKMLTQASASASTEELQTALAASINQCLKLARKQGLGDDLTAVLIRVEPVKVLDKP